MIRAPKF